MRQTAFLGWGALALAAMLVGARAQTPIISEFMAVNSRVFPDERGEYPDWIEIYNPGPGLIDLGGCYLSDDAADLTKWRIPGPVIVGAGGTLVVYASGEDRVAWGRYFHTNFRLSSGGEYLALVAPDGVTRFSEFAPRFPRQFEDISYGVSFPPVAGAPRGYFSAPSPQRPNGIASVALSDGSYAPAVVGDQDDVVVSVRVFDAPAIAATALDLIYRVNFRASLRAAMRDDGLGGDPVAGDGIWTGIIPQAASAPGEMLRWQIQATSTGGGSARLPLSTPLNPGPEYFGTVIADPSQTSQLPVLWWFVQNTAAARTEQGTRCSLYYRGEFYDNVFVRLRGGSSRGWIKPSYKFDFARGYHFRFDPAERRVEEFNLNTTWSDKAYLRQALAFETFRDCGAAGSIAFPLRVQQNGAFHSVAIFIEQVDEDLLQRAGLDPGGALYKMYNTLNSSTNGVEKKTRRYEGNADLQALVLALRATTGRDAWLFDHIDLPAVISYMAAIILMHENDHVHKNYYLYRDSDGDGEWRFLPWDKDLTFGRNYTRSGGVLNDGIYATHDPQSHPLMGDRAHPNFDMFWNHLIDALHANARIRSMFLRRLRTLMDELLQPPGTAPAARHFENRIQALQGEMAADVALDRLRWGVPAYGNRSYDFLTALGRLENLYLAPRRQHLYVTHGPPGGLIPPAQSSALVLRIATVELGGANPDEDYIEVVNCSAEAVDLSGWRLDGRVDFDFEPGTVVPAREVVYVGADLPAFRARAAGPSGGQQLLVVGPFERHARTDLELEDRTGRIIDRISGMRYEIQTGGTGDLALQVREAPAGAVLLIPFSLDTSAPLGCGPFLGLGLDVLEQLGLPPGTAPFNVRADPFGGYSFQAPAGTIPAGVVMDTRAFTLDPASLEIQWSELHRVAF